MATRKIVRWRFAGTQERDGQHRTYTRAYAIYDDGTERKYDVNDVVLCRLDEESTAYEVETDGRGHGAHSDVIDVDEDETRKSELPWVAQIVRFFFDASRRNKERQRVELRWFYYDEHMEADTKVLRGAKRFPPSTSGGVPEVAYSEHVDYVENSVHCVVGKVRLHASEEKLAQALKRGGFRARAPEAEPALARASCDFCAGDRHMLCRTFYLYGTGVACRGPKLRALMDGELAYLLRNGGPHDMWFRFASSPARNAYARAARGRGPLRDAPVDGRVAKTRRVRRGDAARIVRSVSADDEAPVDHDAVKPPPKLTLTDVIRDRSIKLYKLPLGAELD